MTTLHSRLKLPFTVVTLGEYVFFPTINSVHITLEKPLVLDVVAVFWISSTRPGLGMLKIN